MFAKYFCALTAAFPLVLSLTVTTPGSWKGNQTNTVQWTVQAGDPAVFSIELVNDQFHDTFALANNVDATKQSLDIALPQIDQTGPGFVIEFVNIGNVGQVYAKTGSFSIQEQDSESVTQVTSATVPGSASSSVATLSLSSPGSGSSSSKSGASNSISGASSVGSSSSLGGPVTVSPTSSTPSSVVSPTGPSPTTGSNGGANTNKVASGALLAIVAGIVGIVGF